MGIVNNIVAGFGIDVDSSTPASPIVSLDENYRTLKTRFATTANDSLSGLAARDGVTPVAGDRALVNFQTAAAANGIYVAAAGAWTRSTDFDAAIEMLPGTLVSVQEGTVYAASLWMFATVGVIVPGVTSISFAFVGPSFGPDTGVFLPNSSGVPVRALRLQTALTTNTAGAENSNWIQTVLHLGAAREMLRLEHNYIGINDAGIFYQADSGTGFLRNGSGRVDYYSNGVVVMVQRLSGIDLVGNGGDIQIGASAALANNAAAGFLNGPSCTGVPTGVPTPASGKIPLVIGNTGVIPRLYGFIGGAWVVL